MLTKFEIQKSRKKFKKGKCARRVDQSIKEAWKQTKEGRGVKKQGKKDPKNPLDVHMGPTHPIALLLRSFHRCTIIFGFFKGSKIKMAVTLNPAVGLAQSTYRWKAFFEQISVESKIVSIGAKTRKIQPLKVCAKNSTRDCNFAHGNHKNLLVTLLFLWRLVGQGRDLPYKEDCLLQTQNKEGKKESKNL